MWVDRAFGRLYDYGVMLPPDAAIRRDSNIYRRIFMAYLSPILTYIEIYSELFYGIIGYLPDGLGIRYTLQLVLTGLVLIAGSIFFFVVITSSIKASIDILLEKMNAVRDGDYSVSILNYRDDEVGRLYDHFDYMLASLNRVLGGLENEVRTRTLRLEDVLSKMSKYLSPQLYARIYSEERPVELSYSRKKLTVFFSDIIGFTAMSENLAPEDLSRLLNQYLDSMADIALQWGGTIDKYIGDAVMIFFGDPEFTDDRDHALRCVRMAREMLDRLALLRDEWKRAGIPYELHIRIGINTGFCTVGNFGSQARMDYTVLGDAVNLASRLQTAADEDSIYMSETTMLLVRDVFRCDHAGDLSLKGIEGPVRAYRLRDEIVEGEGQAREVLLDGFELRMDPSSLSGTSRRAALKALRDAYDSLKAKGE
jgi:class 3 adenylate cyclase